MNRKQTTLLVLIPLLSACSANFNSIHRRDSITNAAGAKGGEVIFTDAKQAATIASVGRDGVFRACAARSPDVFSALSTAFSGDLEVSAVEEFAGALSGAGSSAESASAFGLRTQLTQSQMELLYQLCINALNGKLSNRDLATELHRYQNTMVTMLGIEQLTGFARPTISSLGGKASTGKAEELLALQNMVNSAAATETKLKADAADKKAKVGQAKEAEAKLKKAHDDAVQTGEKPEEIAKKKKAWDDATADVTTATDLQKNADTATKNATATLGALQKNLDAAIANQDTSASSGSAAVTQPMPSYISNDPTAVKYVSEAVARMQNNHLAQTFIADTCMQRLFPENAASGLKAIFDAGSVGEFCLSYLRDVMKYRFEALYLKYGCDLEGKNCKGGDEDAAAGVGGDVGPFFKLVKPNVILPGPIVN